MQTGREKTNSINADNLGGKPDAKRRLFQNHFVAYAVLVIVPLAAFVLVLVSGGALPPSVGMAASSANDILATQSNLRLPVFLAQIAVIIAVARVFGMVLRKLGQPQVVGEMVAGLALGPSLLGIVCPPAYDWLFPVGTVRFLNALSQIGLVLFMFLVGLELDLKQVRARGWQILVMSHAGMAMPMLGGGVLAIFLYHNYAPADTTFAQFTLFFACAMSVTAFPVLARILAERNLLATTLGATALACASLADVTAWGLLAVALALERGAGNVPAILWHTLLGTVVFLSLMFFVIRPALAFLWRRSVARDGTLVHGELTVILLVVLVSALATEWISLHAIFGAFVAGVIMPRDGRLQSALRARLEAVLIVLLLPLFFAFTGLRTNVGLLVTARDWGFALLILLVAVAGKLGGSAVAARASHIGWREAGALGVLMNSRGLMELVLLTIGLQDGVLTPALFTMMVLMAVVTTMMTTPILARLVPSPAR
jgi:Kef-type K+ transport system membrane component KefB